MKKFSKILSICAIVALLIACAAFVAVNGIVTIVESR